jgi:hypothetical protein
MVTDYAGPPVWPLEAARSVAVGPLWKIGPKVWAWTQVGFIVNAVGQPVWTEVSSGTFELVQLDQIYINAYWISLYLPDKDAAYIFSGGVPDFGPSGPLGGSMTRVPHFTITPPGP